MHLYFLASKNLILINNYPCIFKEKLYDFDIRSGGPRVLTVFCFSSMYPRFLRLLRDPQGLYYQGLRLNTGEAHTQMCGGCSSKSTQTRHTSSRSWDLYTVTESS